jgi:hypothetical protein
MTLPVFLFCFTYLNAGGAGPAAAGMDHYHLAGFKPTLHKKIAKSRQPDFF